MLTYAAERISTGTLATYGGGAATAGLLLAARRWRWPSAGSRSTGSVRRRPRPRLILPLAAMSAGVLTVTWLVPPLWMMLLLLALAGAASAFAIPLNALFGRAVPRQYRGRAFGVAITGLSGLQGTAMVLAGLAADRWAATTVIGFSGLSGAVAVLAFAPLWPRRPASTPATSESPVEQARTTPNADIPTAEAGRGRR